MENSEDRISRQITAANQLPSLDMKLIDDLCTITSHNIEACTVKYYFLSMELLFSYNSFDFSDNFLYTQLSPNHSFTLKLSKDELTKFKIDNDYNYKTLLLVIEYNNKKKVQLYTPCSFNAHVVEEMGILQVVGLNSRPLPRAYCKIYSKSKSGEISYYKDGYTDIQGRFDYVSVSTKQLPSVSKFSIFISSENNGMKSILANPPSL